MQEKSGEKFRRSAYSSTFAADFEKVRKFTNTLNTDTASRKSSRKK